MAPRISKQQRKIEDMEMRRAERGDRVTRVLAPRAWIRAAALLTLLVSGCRHSLFVNTTPLDASGMTYDTIRELKSLKISNEEVGELATARHAGFPDEDCVEVLRVYRARSKWFDAGGNVAGLLQAGMNPSAIVDLARLNQLGVESGELQAMRLAGIPDEVTIEVARHHSEGKPVLSGASLAGMKNAGLRDTTLLELARRGVPDSQTEDIVTWRRRGMKDAEILRRFAGS